MSIVSLFSRQSKPLQAPRSGAPLQQPVAQRPNQANASKIKDALQAEGHNASGKAQAISPHASAPTAPNRLSSQKQTELGQGTSSVSGFWQALAHGLRRGQGSGAHMGIQTGLGSQATGQANRDPAVAFAVYLQRMKRNGQAADLPELFALSQSLHLQIDVFEKTQDGASIQRRASLNPETVSQRISLLQEGNQFSPMLAHPQAIDGAQRFSATRFLPQDLPRNGNSAFESVSMLTSHPQEKLRALACDFLGENSQLQPDFLAGKTLQEAVSSSAKRPE